MERSSQDFKKDKRKSGDLGNVKYIEDEDCRCLIEVAAIKRNTGPI